MNKNVITIILLTIALFAVLMFFLASKDDKIKTESHNAENSLDINGVYYAVLPCASCSGIETKISLKENNEYELYTKYLDKDNLPEILTGKYKWKNGSVISLDNIKAGERPSDYKLEENKLVQLDMSGNAITGDLASNYILNKSGNTKIENRKWQLIEMNGKEIKGDSENYFINFDSKNSTYSAKAGCNNLGGAFFMNDFKFKSFAGFSTMMACSDMKTEADFSKNLETADNLTISEDGNTLSLNKARMAPLLRFKLVK